MTKTQPQELTRGQRIFIYVFGYVGFPLVMTFVFANGIKDGYFPRVEKVEYHWSNMGKDAWAYAPKDDGGPDWSPNVDLDKEPGGGIVKTSDGAWKTMWRLNPCGVGEYLTRELAERCIEKAAAEDGLFGYHLRSPRPAPKAEVKP